MGDKRALAERLYGLVGFDTPRLDLEQYPTPPELAAHLLHLADLQGDIAGQTIVDLGTGTGVLALAAACRGPARVLGLERDPSALAVARENEQTVDPPRSVEWLLGDATRPPLCPETATTVLMNPPFGAQDGNEHADREFLAAAASLADVSYSVHNEGSRAFVESFAADNAGEVTHAFAAELDLDRQFPFHESDTHTVDAEVFRIEWAGDD